MTLPPPGRLEAVCVASPAFSTSPAAGPTAARIDKQPVTGRIAVQRLGLDGDVQVNKKYHGGEGQAVYAYAQEDADFWAAELDRDLPAGRFGENLRTTGLDLTGALLGERWRVGTALLEVTAPRTPCAKFAGLLGRAAADQALHRPRRQRRLPAGASSPARSAPATRSRSCTAPTTGSPRGWPSGPSPPSKHRLPELAPALRCAARPGPAQGHGRARRTGPAPRPERRGALLSAAVGRVASRPDGRSPCRCAARASALLSAVLLTAPGRLQRGRPATSRRPTCSPGRRRRSTTPSSAHFVLEQRGRARDRDGAGRRGGRPRPAGLLRRHPEGAGAGCDASTSRWSPSTAPSTPSSRSRPRSAWSTRPRSASATRAPCSTRRPASPSCWRRPSPRSWGRSAGWTARSSAR